jgi:hypothetical protein
MWATPISRPARKALLISLLFALPAVAADSPTILSRADWGAKPPTLEMEANEPIRLTIHHTATTPNAERSLTEKLTSLQRFSQAEERLSDGRLKVAWADIPYHYYIDLNGAVGEAREAKFIGDSNTEYDLHGHVGIVLEGNFEDEPPTPMQVESLVALLAHLSDIYGIDPEAIDTHQHYAQTACPGKHLIALLPDIRRDVAARLAR